MPPEIAQVSLLVRDYDEAIAYYVGVLDFELLEDTRRSETNRWVVVRPKGGGSALLLARVAGAEQEALVGRQMGGRVGFFLHTDDFGRDHAAMKARGVVFEESPRTESYGQVAVFTDLYGNRWDLLGP
ncbi:MAG TPA: VOC family protein [Candidatus Didemnitutus sp.]|jgi:catechol 2,3-dioxygenase-like lactoylglutathione lyase family enzyme